MEDEPGVGPFAEFHDEVAGGVEHALHLGHVVAGDELFRGGLLEVLQDLGSLPVCVHERGRVLHPGLRGDPGQHVVAGRGPEQAGLLGWRLGQGGGELEDAGAYSVRVGRGGGGPPCPLLEELGESAHDPESPAGVEPRTQLLLAGSQVLIEV